jgi:hypothetical protein
VWKEAFVVCLEVLSQQMLEEFKKTTNNLIQDGRPFKQETEVLNAQLWHSVSGSYAYHLLLFL